MERCPRLIGWRVNQGQRESAEGWFHIFHSPDIPPAGIRRSRGGLDPLLRCIKGRVGRCAFGRSSLEG